MYRRTYTGSSVSSFSAQQTAETDPGSAFGSTRLDKNKRESHFSRKAVKMSKKVDGSKVPLPSVAKTLPEVSEAPKDLMISYSHVDKDMMLKVRDKLEANGISVWVDVSGLQAGVDFLTKIGEAIIDAKVFISLLSSSCVQSRYCQDELALAYVSNSAIYPLAIEDPSDFKNKMNHGMKLQLAPYEWTIMDESSFEARMDELIDKIQAELAMRARAVKNQEEQQAADGKPKVTPPTKNRTMLNRKKDNVLSLGVDGERAAVTSEQFWRDNFKIAESVEYKLWEEALLATFKDEVDEYFDTEEYRQWLKGILRRELQVEDEEGVLYKYNFDSFCLEAGLAAPVWDCVLGKAMESDAMKEVFNMDSSVRIEAVENLGKFRSAAVIDALRDLLSDPDANVRAVASVSLARTEAKDPVSLKYLSKTLNDKDRLVREAGCLALGHL